MKRFSAILASHLAVLLASVAIAWAALPSPGARAVATGPAAERSMPRGRDLAALSSERGEALSAELRRMGPGDLRQMLEDSAAIPLTYREHGALNGRLFHAWGDKDPESLLAWWQAERQGACYLLWPAAQLAARKPELLFRTAEEHGDLALMWELLEFNPQAALRLMAENGITPTDAEIQSGFSSGALSGPGLIAAMGSLPDENLRHAAYWSMQEAFDSMELFPEPADLWHAAPQFVTATDLAGTVQVFLDEAPGRTAAIVQILLPGGPPPGDASHPLEILTLLDRLQAEYLPQENADDWRQMVQGGDGEFDPAALKTLARGDRSEANLEEAAKWWVSEGLPCIHEAMAPDFLDRVEDPVFRDLCLREMAFSSKLTPREGESPEAARRRVLEMISSEAMRVEAKGRSAAQGGDESGGK